MRKLGLLLTLLLPACMGCKATIIDPTLQVYVNSFLALSEAEKVAESVRGLGLTVQFGSASQVSGNPASIGVCTTSMFDRTVTIDTDGWTRLTENQRQNLVNHELGHCILERQHRNDMITGTYCPQSIMNAVMEYDYCIVQYKDEYDYELFHPGAVIPAPTQGSSMGLVIPRPMLVPMIIDWGSR